MALEAVFVGKRFGAAFDGANEGFLIFVDYANVCVQVRSSSKFFFAHLARIHFADQFMLFHVILEAGGHRKVLTANFAVVLSGVLL